MRVAVVELSGDLVPAGLLTGSHGGLLRERLPVHLFFGCAPAKGPARPPQARSSSARSIWAVLEAKLLQYFILDPALPKLQLPQIEVVRVLKHLRIDAQILNELDHVVLEVLGLAGLACFPFDTSVLTISLQKSLIELNIKACAILFGQLHLSVRVYHALAQLFLRRCQLFSHCSEPIDETAIVARADFIDGQIPLDLLEVRGRLRLLFL